MVVSLGVFGILSAILGVLLCIWCFCLIVFLVGVFLVSGVLFGLLFFGCCS